MGFIDMHCHILPDIDDGSENIEQSVYMLKIAYDEGIRKVVATPHYYQGRFEEPATVLRERLACVRESIADTLPEMELYLGSEIYYSHESIHLLKQGIIPTIADTRYILVEFSHLVEYRYLKDGLQELVLEGYSPILAHVERYENVIKKIDRVLELIDMGVYIQVNSMSITGEMGRRYQEIAKKLLKNLCVHIVATDAHSIKTRAPRMKKCFEIVSKKYGKLYANELFVDNQIKILKNQYI